MWLRLIRVVGIAVTALGLSFTGYTLYENEAISHISWDLSSVLILGLTCITYAAVSALLVCVWGLMLGAFAPRSIRAMDVYVIYATTQIMKYIPSNVVHFVGRHMVLHRRGVSHFALVSAVLGEAGLLVGGACLTVAVFQAETLVVLGKRYLGAESLLLIGVPLAILCVWAGWTCVRRTQVAGWTRGINLPRIAVRASVGLMTATAFFMIATLLTALASNLLLQTPVKHGTVTVAAALAGAWIAGFVMPGVSAGIGVRESAVILLLSPAAGASQAAAIAVIYRLVTTGGDVLLAGLGVLARLAATRRQPREK
jgi:glycosyltransferase 2 family protein